MSDKPRDEWAPKDGGYAMHHMDGRTNGTLVRLQAVEKGDGFWIHYVPRGGSSGTWPASEFKPVTDPRLIAVTRKDQADRDVSDLKAKLIQAQHASEIAAAVLECFEEARKADEGS